MIFLVAHPTKMNQREDGTYEECTLYHVSGSADFRNQTHDGNSIYRYFDSDGKKGYTKFTNLKTKMNFQGEIGGSVNFEYDIVNGRYHAQGMPPSTFDMTKPAQDLQIRTNSDILPHEIDEDEMPF